MSSLAAAAALLAATATCQPLPALAPPVKIDMRPMPLARATYWSGVFADTGTTYAALQRGCTEGNGIIPSSIAKDERRLAAYSLVLSGTFDWILQRLWRKGKLSRGTIRNLRYIGGGIRLAVAARNHGVCRESYANSTAMQMVLVPKTSSRGLPQSNR